MAKAPISIRLDDDVRAILERDAASRGVGLATYLRGLATEQARTLRRDVIRAQSREVGRRVRRSSEARDFYESLGTSSSEI
jgi:hypothetical protein